MIASTEAGLTCIDLDFVTDVDIREVFYFDFKDGAPVTEVKYKTFADVLADFPGRLGYVAMTRDGRVVSATGYSNQRCVFLIEEGIISVFLGPNQKGYLGKAVDAEPMDISFEAMTPMGYYASYASRMLQSLPVSYTALGGRVFEYYNSLYTPFGASKVVMAGSEVRGLFEIKQSQQLPLFTPTAYQGLRGLLRRWVYKNVVDETERKVGILFTDGVKSKTDTFVKFVKAGLVPAAANWAKNFATPPSAALETGAMPTFVIKSQGAWPTRMAGDSLMEATVNGMVFSGHLEAQGVISILNGYKFDLTADRELIANNCLYLLTSDQDLANIMGQFEAVYEALRRKAINGLNKVVNDTVDEIDLALAQKPAFVASEILVEKPKPNALCKPDLSSCWSGTLGNPGYMADPRNMSEESQNGFVSIPTSYTLHWPAYGPYKGNDAESVSSASKRLVDSLGGLLPCNVVELSCKATSAEVSRQEIARRIQSTETAIANATKAIVHALFAKALTNVESVGASPDTNVNFNTTTTYTYKNFWGKTKTEHTDYFNRQSSWRASDLMDSGVRINTYAGTEKFPVGYRFKIDDIVVRDTGSKEGKRRISIAVYIDHFAVEARPDGASSALVSEFYRRFWETAFGLRASFGGSVIDRTASAAAVTYEVEHPNGVQARQVTITPAVQVKLLGSGAYRSKGGRGTGYGNFFKGGVRFGRGVAGFDNGTGAYDWAYAFSEESSRRLVIEFSDICFEDIVPWWDDRLTCAADVSPGNIFSKGYDAEQNKYLFVESDNLAAEVNASITKDAVIWLIKRLAEYGDLTQLKAFGRSGNSILTPEMTAMLTEFTMDAEALAEVKEALSGILNLRLPQENAEGDLDSTIGWSELGFELPNGMTPAMYRTQIQAALDLLDDFVFIGRQPWYTTTEALASMDGEWDAGTIPYYVMY